MAKTTHKRWIVVDGETLGNAFLTPDAATEQARTLAAKNVGHQYVVLETTQAYEAEPRVKTADLYRDWESEAKVSAPDAEAAPDLSGLLEAPSAPDAASHVLSPTDF